MYFEVLRFIHGLFIFFNRGFFFDFLPVYFSPIHNTTVVLPTIYIHLLI